LHDCQRELVHSSMLSVRHIELVQALAEHRHFGRAANSLGISQPSLSKALATLEEQVGEPLFERLTMKPTDFGKIVLRHGSAALTSFAEIDRETRRNSWQQNSSKAPRTPVVSKRKLAICGIASGIDGPGLADMAAAYAASNAVSARKTRKNPLTKSLARPMLRNLKASQSTTISSTAPQRRNSKNGDATHEVQPVRSGSLGFGLTSFAFRAHPFDVPGWTAPCATLRGKMRSS
jgi:molybdenum-dependent DNA-binding transcriptional regulator ModE